MLKNYKINHLLPHDRKGEAEVVSIEYDKLFGRDLAWELSASLHSEQMGAFIAFLKNLYLSTKSIYPKKIEDVFTSFRDYSKILDGGNEPKIVIFSNEPVLLSESNGRAFGVSSATKESIKNANMRPFLESVADFYGMNYDDYIGSFNVNHSPSLEEYADEGILMIPVIPVANSAIPLAYRNETITLMYQIIESIAMNTADAVFVLTDPYQEVFEPLLVRQDHAIIKSYELEKPSSFISKAYDMYRKDKNVGNYSIMF